MMMRIESTYPLSKSFVSLSRTAQQASAQQLTATRKEVARQLKDAVKESLHASGPLVAASSSAASHPGSHAHMHPPAQAKKRRKSNTNTTTTASLSSSAPSHAVLQKAPSALELFIDEQRPSVHEKHPQLSAFDLYEKLSQMYSQLHPNQKAHYIARHKARNAELRLQHERASVPTRLPKQQQQQQQPTPDPAKPHYGHHGHGQHQHRQQQHTTINEKRARHDDRSAEKVRGSTQKSHSNGLPAFPPSPQKQPRTGRMPRPRSEPPAAMRGAPGAFASSTASAATGRQLQAAHAGNTGNTGSAPTAHQLFCAICSSHFQDNAALQTHFGSAAHKAALFGLAPTDAPDAAHIQRTLAETQASLPLGPGPQTLELLTAGMQVDVYWPIMKSWTQAVVVKLGSTSLDGNLNSWASSEVTVQYPSLSMMRTQQLCGLRFRHAKQCATNHDGHIHYTTSYSGGGGNINGTGGGGSSPGPPTPLEFSECLVDSSTHPTSVWQSCPGPGAASGTAASEQGLESAAWEVTMPVLPEDATATTTATGAASATATATATPTAAKGTSILSPTDQNVVEVVFDIVDSTASQSSSSNPSPKQASSFYRATLVAHAGGIRLEGTKVAVPEHRSQTSSAFEGSKSSSSSDASCIRTAMDVGRKVSIESARGTEETPPSYTAAATSNPLHNLTQTDKLALAIAIVRSKPLHVSMAVHMREMCLQIKSNQNVLKLESELNSTRRQLVLARIGSSQSLTVPLESDVASEPGSSQCRKTESHANNGMIAAAPRDGIKRQHQLAANDASAAAGNDDAAPMFLLRQINRYLEGSAESSGSAAGVDTAASDIESTFGSQGSAIVDAITSALGVLQDVVSKHPLPWPMDLVNVTRTSVGSIVTAGKLTDASSANVGAMDAAFEALVQVAVFTMTTPRQTCRQTSKRSSADESLMLDAELDPEADTRNNTAALLAGLAAVSTRWALIVSQEIMQVLARHFADLNQACSPERLHTCPADVDMPFHDAIPALLSCLQSDATNPYTNRCSVTDLHHRRHQHQHQHHHQHPFDADADGAPALFYAADALRLSKAAEDAYPLLHFSLENLRNASR